MSEEEVKLVEEYIRKHKPQNTIFETINTAIIAVTKDRRALREVEMVNSDDAWLVPEEKAERFGGIGPLSGRGWAQSIDEHTKQLLEDAAQYAMDHADEIKKEQTEINDLSKMMKEYNEIDNFYKDVDTYNQYIDKGNKSI